jgi:hypothetical protein
MLFFSRSLFTVLCIIIALGASSAQAADDYLKMLEAEAEDLHLDKSGQRENSGVVHSKPVDGRRDWDGECDYMDEAMLPGVVWEEFSSYIKQCYLGTYAYYRRLDDNLQRTIYNSYKKNTPVKQTTLKKEILNYF